MAIIQYEHHGVTVFVEDRLKGTHRGNCLCFKCASFKPGTPENCPKAQELYEYCVKHGMTTPVYECPVFVEVKPEIKKVEKFPDCQYCQMGVEHTHSKTTRSSMVATTPLINVTATAYKEQS